MYDVFMGTAEQNIETPENPHGQLRAQLRAIAAEGDPHFEYISIEELTDTELLLYEKLLADSLTENDLAAYDAAHVPQTTDPWKDGKRNYAAFLRNELVKNRIAQRRSTAL